MNVNYISWTWILTHLSEQKNITKYQLQSSSEKLPELIMIDYLKMDLGHTP